MSDIRTFDPEVEARLDELTTKFNDFITRQKTQIIKSKEDYTNKLTQLRNEHKEAIKQLQSLADRETELNKVLERELHDTNTSQSRLNELKIKEKTLVEERKQLEKSVSELQEKVNERRNELNVLKLNKEKQAERDLPQVLTFEQVLSLRIEGHKEGYLKFTFTNVDPKNTQREFYIILNVEEHLYNDLQTNPEIPHDDLNELLERLNESRDLNKFLKEARQAFKRMV